MPKLASTTFDFNTKPDLVVADVYEATPASIPLNGVVEILSGKVNTVVTNLQSLTSQQSLIGIANDFITGKAKNRDYLVSRLKEATGGTFSDIDGLKNQLIDQALTDIGFSSQGKALIAGLAGVPGSPDPLKTFLEINPRLKIIHDGVEYVKNSKDYKIEDFQTAFKVLGNITGNLEIAKAVDMEARFAAVSSLITISSSLGVPFILDEVKGALSPEETKEAFAQALPAAAKASNIPMVNQIVDEIKPGMALVVKPLLIEFVLANFSVLDAPNGVDLGHANELVAALNKINPNWNKIDRGGVLTTNAGIYASCSADAYKAFLLLPEHRFLAQVPRRYRKLNNMDSLTQSFPRSLVNSK